MVSRWRCPSGRSTVVKPDTMRDASGGPDVAAVVDTDARRPGFLADAAPERVEPVGCGTLTEMRERQ